MAIGIYRSLTFGGIDSATYGVYITGEAVYNSPARSVEMVSVPGRNGAVLIDNGYFENIEVTYPAGIPGTDQSDFATKISDFRNAVLSQVGYQRLTDEYNPSEYRMATYISGLEVEAVEGQQGTVGEFELVFNCKPQRFLTSGEAAVAVANNGTITNPTLFDAKPLLQLKGEGNIAINGETMKTTGGPLGDVSVSDYQNMDVTTQTVTISTQYANPGDALKVNCTIKEAFRADMGISSAPWSSSGIGWLCYRDYYIHTNRLTLVADLWDYSFTYGTSGSTTATITATCTMTDSSTKTAAMAVSCSYDGSNTFTFSITSVTTPTGWTNTPNITVQPIILNSSQSRLGNPYYLDLDLGEAYKIENNVPVSINSGVALPMKLPTLPPGESTITYDNTFTEVKIVPRWWII